MTVSRRSATRVSALVLFSIAAAAQGPSPAAPATPTPSVPEFVANQGQWRAPARFQIRHGAVHTWITDDAMVLHAERGEVGVAVEFGWEGASGSPRGAAPSPTLRHWLRSPELGGCVTDVPAFAGVRQPGLYEHIDLLLRQQDGHVEYDLELAAGARLEQVSVRVRGHDRLRLDDDGALVVDTALGELRQTPPVTYATDGDGTRRELASRFVLRGTDRFGFAVDGLDAALAAGAVTIDPGIAWGTMLGGSGLDRCNAVREDSTGAVITAGVTTSADLPTSVGAFRTTPYANDDAFVARFVGTGQLSFCTYLGGSFADAATDLRILSNDTICIAGETASTNFPLTGSRYQPINGGNTDAFATILPTTGNLLLYSTYYGGTGFDTDIRLWVTPNGDIWLAGRATGSTPVTANAFQIIGGGQGDVFLGVINRSVGANPPLRYGSLFGAAGDEIHVHSLHVDGNDIATIGFTTDSPGLFTTATTFQSAIVGGTPTGFIVCFDPANPSGPGTVIYASYFGSAGGTVENLFVEQDTNGFFCVAGTTSASTWPTSPAVSSQAVYGGGATDGLVSRFDPGANGSAALLITTYLGGSGDDRIETMSFAYAQGTLDLCTVGGSTTSTDFPVSTNAFQTTPSGGGTAGFCSQLNFRLPGFLQREYSTYYDAAGSGDEVVRGVTRGPAGRIDIAGETTAAVAPGSAAAFQQTTNGGTEGFVARLDRVALPAPFTTYGAACGLPGFVPALAGGTVGRIGQSFSVDMTNLRPNGGGFMVLGVRDTDWIGAPLPFDLTFFNMPGCFLHNSADQFYFLLYSGSTASFGLPVPVSMQFHDIRIFFQFMMIDLAANAQGLVASNGVGVHLRW